MFGITHYEMFLIAGIILNLTPGSDTIYILSRSIAQGRRAGVYSVIGICSGIAIHTFLAAHGLTMILAQSAIAFNAVKLCGTVYLCYLGITTLLAKESVLISETAEQLPARQIYFQGFLTNVLNPKVAIFFLSFLPQFIQPQSEYGILPFLMLGGTFLATGFVWCLVLVACSSGLTAFLRRNSKAAYVMNKACGGIYLLLGAKMLTIER